MRVGRRGVAIAAVCLSLFGGWARAGTSDVPFIRFTDVYTAGIEGGEEVAVTGGNFTPDLSVALGDAAVANLVVEDASHLRFRVPRQQAAGYRTLTVRNRAGIDQIIFFITAKPLAELAPCEITTVAGMVSPVGDNNFRDSSSVVLAPLRVARDADGNVYVADVVNHRVRRIDRDGTIITVVGCGRVGDDGDGGPAAAAALDAPAGVAVDRRGNLFVADLARHRVRRVDAATGIITTIAGTGEEGFSGDGGSASAAALRYPLDVAVDEAGNVFVSDTGNGRVRRIDAQSGTISTVAGGGACEGDDEGGPATSACLGAPDGICLDAAGNLYVADRASYRIRKVDAATGAITTVAGTGQPGADDASEGPATEISLNEPFDVVADGDGTLYVVDGRPGGGDYLAFGVVRRIDPSGWMTTLDSERTGYATGLALDDHSNLYIADPDDGYVRVISSSSGLFSVFAGSGATAPIPAAYTHPATQATFAPVRDMEVTAAGDLYILQVGPILHVDAATGIVGFVPINAGGFFGSSHALAVDRAGNVFTSESDLSFPTLVHRISARTGRAKVLAGGGDRAPRPGIAGRRVSLYFADYLAADRADHLYVSDAGVLELDSKTGRVLQYYPNVGGAITVDNDGTLYATGQGVIVRRSGGGFVPVAGNGRFEVSGDGGPATEAGIGFVVDIAVDRAGNLYILGENRVRRVEAATGIITTIAGNGVRGYTGDAGPARDAMLEYPIAIGVDGDGNVYVANSQGIVRAIKAGC